MKLVYSIISFSLVCGLLPSLASAQGALDKTTLGKQQNDARELANSLVPGEQKYGGKGEKKEKVNTAELKSKSIKDTTFGGSLLNVGIDPAVPKLDEQKLHNAPSEKESQTSKEAEAAVPKDSTQARAVEQEGSFLNLSDTAMLAQQANQSDAAADKGKAQPNANGDGLKKEEKAADKEKDKASADKSDGEH
jgi:hypothetical protein